MDPGDVQPTNPDAPSRLAIDIYANLHLRYRIRFYTLAPKPVQPTNQPGPNQPTDPPAPTPTLDPLTHPRAQRTPEARQPVAISFPFLERAVGGGGGGAAIPGVCGGGTAVR